MEPELYYLIACTLLTGLLWVPYILNRFWERGIIGAITKVNAPLTPDAVWAQRAMNAHRNAIENLAVFAPLALSTAILGVQSDFTAFICMAFFMARLAHAVVVIAGIPVLRTVAFLSGFACQMALGITLLSALH